MDDFICGYTENGWMDVMGKTVPTVTPQEMLLHAVSDVTMSHILPVHLVCTMLL